MTSNAAKKANTKRSEQVPRKSCQSMVNIDSWVWCLIRVRRVMKEGEEVESVSQELSFEETFLLHGEIQDFSLVPQTGTSWKHLKQLCLF